MRIGPFLTILTFEAGRLRCERRRLDRGHGMANKKGRAAPTNRGAARIVAITLLAIFWIGSASVASALSSVRSGSDPKLDADEGLLLVAIDTNIPLTAVHLRKDGKMLAAGVLANLPKGRTLRLYSAPAGKYRWSEIAVFSSYRYRFSNLPDYEFEVKPGRITYVGDLVFRPTGYFGADIHLANRGLTALDWLESGYPAVFARYPFEYVGRYPDPFPDFYRELRKNSANKALPSSKLVEPPKAAKLSLTPELLWRADHVTSVNLSPSGKLLAEQTRVEGQDAWTLDLVDLVSGTATSLVRSDFPFTSIQWSGNSTLVVSMGRSGAPQLINVFTVGSDATGKRNFQRWKLPIEGRVVDVLPNDPGHILFTNIDSHGRMLVHKLDIGSEVALRSFSPSFETRLNKQIDNDLWWFTDGDGELRIALASKADARLLMKCTDSGCEEVFTFKADGGFRPMGLSWDGGTLYGITEEDRAQIDLVAFDTATKSISKTLFSKVGIDVVAPILDSRRNPIGVNYYEGGRLVSEYFDQGNQGRAEMLGRAFNGKTVMVIDQNRDASQLILAVDSADQPPQLFHLDVAKHQASLIDDDMPALANVKFAPTQRVTAKAIDGTEIEGFLTLPTGAGERPLIVLAHGGPIGISDDLHFDRDVQFMASLGYAVLRVNFRGSGGHGKAFREAGQRKYGTLIEDDINTVLQRVLGEYPLDASRMCAVGFSYGGYSSLVSAIRWPDRFRCVVSVAGISDKMLFFTASDSGRSKVGREQLEKIVGDPFKDAAEMMETSPLYHYAELRVPVMLAHGDEDERVDLEHTRRLQRVLAMDGRPPVGHVFKDAGHGFGDNDLHTLWNGIAGFLQQNLDHADSVEPLH